MILNGWSGPGSSHAIFKWHGAMLGLPGWQRLGRKDMRRPKGLGVHDPPRSRPHGSMAALVPFVPHPKSHGDNVERVQVDACTQRVCAQLSNMEMGDFDFP